MITVIFVPLAGVLLGSFLIRAKMKQISDSFQEEEESIPYTFGSFPYDGC